MSHHPPRIDPTTIPPFVDAGWLAARDGEVVLADVRYALDGSEGEHTYRAAHLPGAVHVDLDAALAAPPSAEEGRHPLPEPAPFAAALGRLGIGDGMLVVAYDQGPGAFAARLVWMLRAIGQPAAVLDGGLAAWTGPTATGVVVREPVRRVVVAWPPSHLIGTGELERRHRDDDVVVLDARDTARYAGGTDPIDARAGHIPGARSAPVVDNLAAGRLRPLAELRERYTDLGALDAPEVVAYCGSGVTACHDLLVLESLGVAGRLYPGSWSAWAANARLPIASGPDLGTSIAPDAGTEAG